MIFQAKFRESADTTSASLHLAFERKEEIVMKSKFLPLLLTLGLLCAVTGCGRDNTVPDNNSTGNGVVNDNTVQGEDPILGGNADNGVNNGTGNGNGTTNGNMADNGTVNGNDTVNGNGTVNGGLNNDGTGPNGTIANGTANNGNTANGGVNNGTTNNGNGGLVDDTGDVLEDIGNGTRDVLDDAGRALTGNNGTVNQSAGSNIR